MALVEVHCTLGNAWAAIAQCLPGRTALEIKNIWHSTLRARNLRTRSILRAYVHALKDRSDKQSARQLALRAAHLVLKEQGAKCGDAGENDDEATCRQRPGGRKVLKNRSPVANTPAGPARPCPRCDGNASDVDASPQICRPARGQGRARRGDGQPLGGSDWSAVKVPSHHKRPFCDIENVGIWDAEMLAGMPGGRNSGDNAQDIRGTATGERGGGSGGGGDADSGPWGRLTAGGCRPQGPWLDEGNRPQRSPTVSPTAAARGSSCGDTSFGVRTGFEVDRSNGLSTGLSGGCCWPPQAELATRTSCPTAPAPAPESVPGPSLRSSLEPLNLARPSPAGSIPGDGGLGLPATWQAPSMLMLTESEASRQPDAQRLGLFAPTAGPLAAAARLCSATLPGGLGHNGAHGGPARAFGNAVQDLAGPAKGSCGLDFSAFSAPSWVSREKTAFGRLSRPFMPLVVPPPPQVGPGVGMDLRLQPSASDQASSWALSAPGAGDAAAGLATGWGVSRALASGGGARAASTQGSCAVQTLGLCAITDRDLLACLGA